MKKYLNILFLFGTLVVNSQIKGNGEIVQKQFPTESIRSIEVSLYANITIDAALENSIRIKTDNNLFKHIDREVVEGKLKLDQLKWIAPSQRMEIVIGAPDLQRVQLGTNDQIRIINLDTGSFSATALNGLIFLEGRSNILNMNSEHGTVDARELETQQVYVNIWSDGKALFNTAEKLEVKAAKDSEVVFNQTPAEVSGKLPANKPEDKGEVTYINFKIRNNSDNRQNFYVIGPKPDGRKFSYGFPMMPGAERKENWTTGTKVYKVTGLGLKKLLVTIKKEDENKTVDLF